MEREYTITRSQLAKALDQWEADAKAGNWDQLPEHATSLETADYLLEIMSPEQEAS